MSDDEQLLTAWQAGDQGAGSTLFRRHFGSVRRFFRTKVPQGDVEDLIQNTFTGCVMARERFRAESSFRTFLFSVARRQLYKFIRDRASHDARVDPDLGVSSINGLGLTPSAVVAAREEEGYLLQALQRVSVEHQIMLELYYWEQIQGAEIAEILDIAPATVRTRLHRARKALEPELRKLMAGKPDIDIDEVAASLLNTL